MSAFEEFMFDENYVLRFYRVDHGLVCTINESMVPELRELESKLRQQQAEIEALQSAISGNKEVMADWEAELKSVREMNTICWRSNRAKQAEIEELKAELHKYKPQIWEVMKEANNERK